MRSAAIAAVVALVLAGCGGADDAMTTDTSAMAPNTPSTAPGSVVSGGETPGAVPGGATGLNPEMAADPTLNEITSADASHGTPVKLSARTPKEFSSAHCTRPIMVVLHQPGSILDTALLREARKASATVKDVKFLVYTPRQVRAYGDLPAKLGLLSAPSIAIVARDGTIENFWPTYVDNKLIAASLRNAASEKPCRGASAEADPSATGEHAAPSNPLADAASLVAGNAKPAPAVPVSPADPASAAAPGGGAGIAAAASAVNGAPGSMPAGAGAVTPMS